MRKLGFVVLLATLVGLAMADSTHARGRRGGCYRPCYPSYHCYPVVTCSPVVVICHPQAPKPPNGEKKPPTNTIKKPPPPECDRIFCLFIGGTLDKSKPAFVKGIPASLEMVEALFDADVLKQKVGDRKKTLVGEEASPDNIRKACEELDLGKNDSVFVFYCGHGGTVEGSGHCLFPLAGGAAGEELKHGPPLPRKDVTDILIKKSPRFICFVTDACANQLAETVETPKSATDGKNGRQAIVKLMVENTGIFDVNGCSEEKGEEKGQRGFVFPSGGLFTKVFVNLARSYRMDSDGDGKVSWKKEFFPVLQKETDAAFQNYRATVDDLTEIGTQKHMVPQRYPRGAEAAGTAGLGAPLAPGGGRPATIAVTLPADTTLTFDGERTRSNGPRREFVTPPLAPGKVYTYTAKATRRQGGRDVSVTQEIRVRAGEITPVRITFPATVVASR